MCEVLNLNYRDGWFFLSAPSTPIARHYCCAAASAYEISPIDDGKSATFLLPDSNRVFLSAGASYKYPSGSSSISAYSHIFFEDADFCIASAVTAAARTAAPAPHHGRILSGNADVLGHIVALGLRYRF